MSQTHPDCTNATMPEGYHAPAARVEMRVLCSLSPRPRPLSDVAEETGFQFQSELRGVIERLEHLGVFVDYMHDAGHQAVAVTKRSWPRARQLAEEYSNSL